MTLINIWLNIFILLYLFNLILSNEDELLKKISISYISKIDEEFYPIIPQFIKMIGREKIISNYMNSYKKLNNEISNDKKNWMFDHIDNELNNIKKNMNEDIEILINKHKIKFLKNSNKEFWNFLNELKKIYDEFGLNKIYNIYIEIKYIGEELEKYINNNKKEELIKLSNNWNNFLNKFFNSEYKNNSILKLKKKLDLIILSYFIEKQIIKKKDFNIKEFNLEFSNKFWDNHLSHNNLIKFFEDYTIYQLNIIYKLKLLWIKIILSILFINIEDNCNNINNLGRSTMVHKITLTSLQYLNHIRSRIDYFLYDEPYINELINIYNNLSKTMDIWMNWTLILEDLEYLYGYLMRENIEIKILITSIFDKIRKISEIDIINKNNINKNNIYSIGLSRYLRNLDKIDNINKLKDIFFSNLRINKRLDKLLEENIDNNLNIEFEEIIETNIISEIENLLINNNELFIEYKEINNLLDNLNIRFERFNRQSNIFIIELKSTSSNCQLLFLTTTQYGNKLYEIVANNILNNFENYNKNNTILNNKFKNLINDLEPIKYSIEMMKDTEKTNEPTDIFGENISDEDFIYVPNTIEIPKKNQDNGNLLIRISIIISLLLLAILLYIYKDRILIKNIQGIEKENEFNERYCSRVSLDEIDFELLQNDDEKYELLRKKYYKLDRKSGNIILRHKNNN